MTPANDLILYTLDAVVTLGPNSATSRAIWDSVNEQQGIEYSDVEVFSVLHGLRDAGCIAPELRDGSVHYSITNKGRRVRDRSAKKAMKDLWAVAT